MSQPHDERSATRQGSAGFGGRLARSTGLRIVVLLAIVAIAAYNAWNQPHANPLPDTRSPAAQREIAEDESAAQVPSALPTHSAPPLTDSANSAANTSPSEATASGSPEKTATQAAANQFIIENVTLKNLDGKTVYRGRVDLTASVQRIERGERLGFRNDGSLFQNREGRLPRQASGYYHEWVHPTPQLHGPGPQRLVTGANGELYYTHDHYRSFKKIR